MMFLDTLVRENWEISKIILSDRDTKFLSVFWKEVFKQLNTSFIISIAYYLQTDNQSKHIN